MATATMEPEVEQMDADEKDVTFRDLVPEDTCPIDSCAFVLGLDVRTVRNAVFERKLSRPHGNSGVVFAESVERWLKDENIAFVLDEKMVARHRKRSRSETLADAARAESETKRRAGVAYGASAQAETWRAQEQENSERVRDEMWGEYAAILLADADGDKANAKRLAVLVMGLDLSEEQIETDQQIVKRAHALTLAHLAFAERLAVRVAAREACKRIRLEYRARILGVEREYTLADCATSESHGASYELGRLQKRRPFLFEPYDREGHEIPRLLSPPEPADPIKAKASKKR